VIEAASDEGVRVLYDSPRRLCAFLHGLVEGTAMHYAETVEVTEETCMLRGDAACLFRIGVGQRAG
jgi:predicted hydrocarbon binding protein